MIRWRVQRSGSAVDWVQFRDDLREILASPRYRDDVIKLFYSAVAQYHCGEITDANASFANLRRMQLSAITPREIRCYYLGVEGRPKQFQGITKRQNAMWYIEIGELGVSVPARAPTQEGGPGSTAHAYIGFSLNGPLAVFVKPGEGDTLLAA